MNKNNVTTTQLIEYLEKQGYLLVDNNHRRAEMLKGDRQSISIASDINNNVKYTIAYTTAIPEGSISELFYNLCKLDNVTLTEKNCLSAHASEEGMQHSYYLFMEDNTLLHIQNFL